MVTLPKPAGSELTQGSFPRPTLYDLDTAQGEGAGCPEGGQEDTNEKEGPAEGQERDVLARQRASGV